MFRPLNPTQVTRLQRIPVMILALEDWFMYKCTRKGHKSFDIKRVSHTAEQLYYESEVATKTCFCCTKQKHLKVF